MWPKIKEITLATTKVKNGNIGTGVTFLKWEKIWKSGKSKTRWKNKMKKQDAIQLYLPSLTLICLYLPVGFSNCLISFKFAKEWMPFFQLLARATFQGKLGTTRVAYFFVRKHVNHSMEVKKFDWSSTDHSHSKVTHLFVVQEGICFNSRKQRKQTLRIQTPP